MNQRLYFLSRASGDSFKLEEQSRSWWAPYYRDPEIKNLSAELATYSSDALFFRFNCAKKSPFPQKAMPTFTFQTLPFLSLSMSCGVCLFAGFKSSSFFQPSSPKWEDLQKPFWSLLSAFLDRGKPRDPKQPQRCPRSALSEQADNRGVSVMWPLYTRPWRTSFSEAYGLGRSVRAALGAATEQLPFVLLSSMWPECCQLILTPPKYCRKKKKKKLSCIWREKCCGLDKSFFSLCSFLFQFPNLHYR